MNKNRVRRFEREAKLATKRFSISGVDSFYANAYKHVAPPRYEEFECLRCEKREREKESSEMYKLRRCARVNN